MKYYLKTENDYLKTQTNVNVWEMDFTNLNRDSLKSETIYLLVILWSIDTTCAMHVKFGPWDSEILIRK